MSQYPTPYIPPNVPSPGYYYGADPWSHLTRPARQAGVLMMVLGGLGLVCAGCVGAIAGLVPLNEMPPEQIAAFQQLEAETGLSATTALRIVAAIMALPGLVFILLGAFVRAGSVVAEWISVILTGLMLLLLAFNVLTGVVQAIAEPAAAAAHGVGVAMALVLAGLFVLLLVWLIRAISAAGQLKVARLQYQMQYWQYAQRQQAYGQGNAYQQPQPPGMMPPTPSVVAPPTQLEQTEKSPTPPAPDDGAPDQNIGGRPASGPAKQGASASVDPASERRP